MKKVVLTLGVCLGALSLAACEAQQESAEAAELQAEVEPAPVEAAPVVADELTTEAETTTSAEGAVSEVAPQTEGEPAPAN